MRSVILDFRADSHIINTLQKNNVNVIPTFNCAEVGAPLSGHADIQICKISEDVFISAPRCYEYYKDKLSQYNVKIICGKTQISSNYPNDIAYNVAWIGKHMIHNFKYTDTCVLDYMQNLKIKPINVAQGYSKCNVCVVSDDAVITSDVGIHTALEAAGVDSLLISDAGIDINGWDRGFIGGASGKIDKNTLAFCGDVSSHPDYNRINEFCSKYQVVCISLSQKRLMDYGSLISVNQHY